MFFVYILKSLKDNKLYTGYTSDLRNRLEEHNSGKSKSTSLRRPFKLIYYEAYLSKDDAERREEMLKLNGRALAQLKARIGKTMDLP